MHDEKKDSFISFNFDAIRLKLASPDDIHRWSHGEVTRPETINYRTQRPEKDGLFSERIFGPTKDWECYCGKYKKIRYKGIVCDKCNVEVTRSIVRRERMGHIDLASPVSHIWFLRGVPSKVGLMLDLSVQNLEKVVYFASFIVIEVHEEEKASVLERLSDEFKTRKKAIEQESNREVQLVHNAEGVTEKEVAKRTADIQKSKAAELCALDERLAVTEEELKNLKPFKIMSENAYREMSLKYGHIFEAGIGAEALRKLLVRLDLKKLEEDLSVQIEETQGLKHEKLLRRAKLVRHFLVNGLRPEWMILSTVPIIPPDLRPMVALDGGRFATSDLNDLYRRVINRNNRLKQLIELRAPEVICRNEKRMLQEAVDALIDNSARHGKTVVASTGQKRMLKSLADMLKGKRGRFRQNLLGKRIDYSGRSVIVVGPNLKLHECGIPKRMALDLFKPFIISQLIKREYVYNVRSASRFIESGRIEVWDILEEIVKDSYVLLNRAPTLHRLGIQAFKPILIEGKAIQIHPLVCSAFNADFDGDQMAVHIPLSREAREEAAEIMLSSRNLLRPANGDPITLPTQDIIWGAYFMTEMTEEETARDAKDIQSFFSEDEAHLAYSLGKISLREKISVRPSDELKKKCDGAARILETTASRLLFNNLFPSVIPFVNRAVDKKGMLELIAMSFERCGMGRTAELLDDIKKTCGFFLTTSGLSFGMNDIPTLPEKGALIKEAERKINEVESQYDTGLLTFQERKNRIIDIWTEARDSISKVSKKSLDLNKKSSTYSIIESGARGTWAQLNQIIGMKGLLANPSGEIMELAVKSSFKEGLGVLEYFISTHGARKGLVDTALRTSSAGYLTRRLVDVSQDVVIREEDCHDKEGVELRKEESDVLDIRFTERLMSRVAFEAVVTANGEVIVEKGGVIRKEQAKKIEESGIVSVRIRSILSCRSLRGVCQKCYGVDPATSELVKCGTAVGIIAAQSLGEPATQLTMRTFHTGGIAGVDITQGLPRVEELFEVRTPKNRAVTTDVSGTVSLLEKKRSTVNAAGKEIMNTSHDSKIIAIQYEMLEEDVYRLRTKKGGEESKKTSVADGQSVMEGAVLFVSSDGKEVCAKRSGTVKNEKSAVKVLVPMRSIKEYVIPATAYVTVKEGDLVSAGDPLTEGSFDLQTLYQYKGKAAVQRYVINEIQHIYTSQAQRINDKHMEIIVRQMFSRIYVSDAGDTELLPGEVVERSEFLEANKKARKEDIKEAKGDELLMGITKASLSTRSWLSAASFQETARVLINAAVTGKTDYLEGLKENVIIGRLIPVGTGYRPDEKK